MTDNEFNIIPAVESLQNVPSLTPTQQREQRKRRAKPAPQRTEADEQSPQESAEDQTQLLGHDDGHSIDYCA